MDKLKSDVETASQAVDGEREKNVNLLELMFPPEIARRLWHGKQKKHWKKKFPVTFIFIVIDYRTPPFRRIHRGKATPGCDNAVL